MNLLTKVQFTALGALPVLEVVAGTFVTCVLVSTGQVA
jgi:hypothetical protein